jgi:hypothetical protein
VSEEVEKEVVIRIFVSFPLTSFSFPQKNRYLDGIYLLHPTTADAATKSTTNTSRSPTLESDFDIVFIHGVTGSPFNTWRALQEEDSQVISLGKVRNDEHCLPFFSLFHRHSPPKQVVQRDENQRSEIWPRDWVSAKKNRK